MPMKRALIVLAVLLAGCQKSSPVSPLVPEAWHLLPERADHVPQPSTPEQEEALGNHVELVLGTYAHELGEVQEAPIGSSSLLAATSAVPWHLEYFITDLTLSASGVLG